MARDIASKFNNIYGDVLKLPEPDISKETQLVPGIDGQKMSKSYNNTIPIFGKEKEIRKKFMSIVTDMAGIDEPKNKNTPLFHLYCLFANKEERKILTNRYDTPGLRYGDIKVELYEKMMDYFLPYREKRASLLSKPDEVADILKMGAKKAKVIASEVLERIKSVIGLKYQK